MSADRSTAADRATTTPPEVVRSEERLAVSHEPIVVGRARFGKRVVTEERTVTVTVRREEFYLEELPPGPADGAGRATTGSPDGPVVLVLHEEEPVVETRVVPRERVTVTVERSTEQQQVDAELARERVEVTELEA